MNLNGSDILRTESEKKEEEVICCSNVLDQNLTDGDDSKNDLTKSIFMWGIEDTGISVFQPELNYNNKLMLNDSDSDQLELIINKDDQTETTPEKDEIQGCEEGVKGEEDGGIPISNKSSNDKMEIISSSPELSGSLGKNWLLCEETDRVEITEEGLESNNTNTTTQSQIDEDKKTQEQDEIQQDSLQNSFTILTTDPDPIENPNNNNSKLETKLVKEDKEDVQEMNTLKSKVTTQESLIFELQDKVSFLLNQFNSVSASNSLLLSSSITFPNSPSQLSYSIHPNLENSILPDFNSINLNNNTTDSNPLENTVVPEPLIFLAPPPPPIPPPGSPGLPPPPGSSSDKRPAKSYKESQANPPQKTLEQLKELVMAQISISSITGANKPRAVEKYISTFSKSPRKLEKLIIDYPLLVRTYPLSPSKAYKISQMWETGIFEQLTPKEAKLWRSRKNFEISKLEKEEEIKEEIVRLWVVVEGKRKEEKEKEKRDKLGNVMGNVLEEMKRSIQVKAKDIEKEQEKEEMEKAEREEDAIDIEPDLISSL